MTNYLVIMRHGESVWNKQNLFTGFKDVDLTDKGTEEAIEAGQKLKLEGIKFDTVFTSTQKRAIITTELALKNANQEGLIETIIKHPDLRERNYGDLTGLNKAETMEKYGEDQVHIWRRSYDTQPPGGECLQDVVENRVRPYYEAAIKPMLDEGKNVLIGAHGNSLRAMLIVLGINNPDNINTAEMPTGKPRVIELDKGKVISDRFL